MLYAFKLKPNVIHVQWTRISLIDGLLYKVFKILLSTRLHSPQYYTVHGEKNLIAQIQSVGIYRFCKFILKSNSPYK